MTFEAVYKGIAQYYEELGPQTDTECDNAAHGYGCQCLKGRNAKGEVIDEILVGLEEELEDALIEEEDAEGEVEYAQEKFSIAVSRVNKLESAIKKHRESKS